MERYDYLENVTEDVKTWINDNIEEVKAREDREDARGFLNDRLFNCDAVTGNASGSYTFNSYQAAEYLAHNWDEVVEVAEEWGEVADMSKGPEYWDVCLRCYHLGAAIDKALEDLAIFED